ncbi:FKBP-type peptidyl-prolyl cis-trans isomerase [Candidatus Aenigmatarchaeota archaeon]
MNMQLKIEDTKEGKGKSARKGCKVSVHYTGMFENGKVFDSSRQRNEPFIFKLGNGEVIPGWDQGVVGMKIGGHRKLTVPSELAYGKEGVPGVIPPNSTLVFKIELIDVK